MTKHILTYCLIALFLSACNDGLVKKPPPDGYPLRLELEINGDEPERWQDVAATFTVTNISNKAITFSFPSSCQFRYTVERNGQIIFDSRHNFMCLAVLTSFKLKPGENKTFPIDLKYVGDGAISEGIYRVSAFLLEEQSTKASKIFKK